MTDCSGGGSSGSSNNETPATSTATVTGLDPNTRYYFAVSAYNGLSGPCSNEVLTVTPLSGVASLAWGSVQDPTVSAYDIHYGKQPSGGPGDCIYPDSMRVLSPSRS
ncbi:MAG: fibronectin type III domain-containing protein [Nitrospira sp.]|nr:fibronectin type III domain-containing protein [Nitrospira sp.]